MTLLELVQSTEVARACAFKVTLQWQYRHLPCTAKNKNETAWLFSCGSCETNDSHVFASVLPTCDEIVNIACVSLRGRRNSIHFGLTED